MDRFGVGWRPELAAGILANATAVDVVEVIADDWVGAASDRIRALRTLGAQIPLVLHSVGLGLATRHAVEPGRLAALARLVEAVRPVAWSEHLAFVRSRGRELGHLAAPPRCAATLAGLVRNVERAAAMVGEPPQLENVATLYDPPGSDRDEAGFVADALLATGADLLLDLHNLYANATNFGFDPRSFLGRLPAGRIAGIHIAGGSVVRDAPSATQRLLDDHRHDVPDPVFALLEEMGRLAPRPLTVILERDGRYPPIERLLGELDRARAALARGRAQRTEATRRPVASSHARPARAIGLAAPAASGAGDAEEQIGAWLAGARTVPSGSDAALDETGLRLAAESFRRKREHTLQRPRRAWRGRP
jgi:uncharacterized protein (UPF0276 family)